MSESKTERDLRALLETSADDLFNAPSKKRLLQAIYTRFPPPISGCVLEWIPEQGEDIFLILVDGSELLSIEIDRLNDKAVPIIKDVSMKTHLKGLKAQGQIKLSIAKEICAQMGKMETRGDNH